MYENKMICVIKSNGQVLREFKDQVYLNFGSEYQIYLKNLNTVRALVHVDIDGTDITPNGLVINANSEISLERSLANGSLTEGNRFKFIERTGNIEQHRGIGAEDGIVRVEFQFERVYQSLWSTTDSWNTYKQYVADPNLRYGSTGGILRNTVFGSNSLNVGGRGTSAGSTISAQSFNATFNNDAGITVPGSHSNQSFSTVSAFPLESEKHAIVLKLLGHAGERPVLEPVTVKSKPKCQTCGKLNKATAKFCTECGTSLVLFA